MGVGCTIVTQTRVREGHGEAFGRFQAAISAAVAGRAGFIEQSVLPPRPPAQADWVILQRFASQADAVAWLRAPERAALVATIVPSLAGQDDVHLVPDGAGGAAPAPVSMVITTRVKPGSEAAFQAWERKITAAQSAAAGFLGYRLEPPIAGVQESYLAILRFESDAALQGWMGSAERGRLLEEAAAAGFAEEVHLRSVQAAFSQWFPGSASVQAPAWKQNMLVLLMLYPVVFLFGWAVGTPVLMGRVGMPFWLALFFGNVFSVVVLTWLVPAACRAFGWWLAPAAGRGALVEWGGVAALVGLYCGMMAVFSVM